MQTFLNVLTNWILQTLFSYVTLSQKYIAYKLPSLKTELLIQRLCWQMNILWLYCSVTLLLSKSGFTARLYVIVCTNLIRWTWSEVFDRLWLIQQNLPSLGPLLLWNISKISINYNILMNHQKCGYCLSPKILAKFSKIKTNILKQLTDLDIPFIYVIGPIYGFGSITKNSKFRLCVLLI